MKKLLLLVMGVVMLLPVSAQAQNVGAIMLYSDINATSCNITENPVGLVMVYVFHRYNTGVTASKFKIQDNGTNFCWLADSPQNGTIAIGDSNEGASFVYPSCIASDFNFVNVLCRGFGTAGVCSSLEVVPDPGALSGEIEATDCTPLKYTADGSILTVNCADEFLCSRIVDSVESTTGGDMPDCPVPVESTTWGAVKALYE